VVAQRIAVRCIVWLGGWSNNTRCDKENQSDNQEADSDGVKRVPATPQLPPVSGQRIRTPAGHLVVDGHWQKNGVNNHRGEKRSRAKCEPSRRAPRRMCEKNHSEAQQERKRIPKWHRRAKASRQCLSSSNMHRIVKAADARVKENGHRNLVTGHRTSNYNSGNLKSLDGGISHECAENSSAKSSNENKISYAFRRRGMIAMTII